MEKVLIAIDNSPHSDKVVKKGLELAERLNAKAAILSVVDIQFVTAEVNILSQETTQLLKDEFYREHQTHLNKFDRHHKVESLVEEGNPYEEILRMAKEWEADIIVLGTMGRTGLSHLMIGSVAEKVLRHSSIPVFIVPLKASLVP
jgi:nucleotide-binding universal stress UspA family protein